MTQNEIITRVKERLDEDAATSQRYTDADITEYTLDGARFYVASTGCQYASTTITTVDYQMLYDLPCDFIQVERVLWDRDGEYYPLEATSPRTLDEYIYQWQRQTDTRPRGYFIFAPRKIGLYPLTGGEDVIVHYQQDVHDSIAAVPVEDHEALVEYVLARLLAAEGQTQYAAEHYAEYAAVVKAAKRRAANADRRWEMSSRG